MRRVVTAALALFLVAACSSSNPATFTVGKASVDATYFCPGGVNNAAYTLHAVVDVHNGTDKPVTIEGATAQMTVASIKGSWLEKVGDRYDASNVKFTPTTVDAGKDASLQVTVPSACTSGSYGSGTSSSADYDVTFHMTTSAGTFAITAANQHEIVGD